MFPSTGVVIPSAGKGSRMEAGLAKQLLSIGGITILAHSISRILKLPGVRYLVIPTSSDLLEETQDIVDDLLNQLNLSSLITMEVIPGGKERMDSVYKGLMSLEKTDAELVLIHDAVRPFFPLDAASQTLNVAYEMGAAILAVPSRDTVKIADNQRRIMSTPDRKSVWLAQTPQAFQKKLLIKAFENAKNAGFLATDDASVMEFAGYPVQLIPGSHENIKITYPSDLDFAKQWFSTQNKNE